MPVCTLNIVLLGVETFRIYPSLLPHIYPDHTTRRTTNIGIIIYLSPSSLPLSGLVDGSYKDKIYPLLLFYNISRKCWGRGGGVVSGLPVLFIPNQQARKVRALLKNFGGKVATLKHKITVLVYRY